MCKYRSDSEPRFRALAQRAARSSAGLNYEMLKQLTPSRFLSHLHRLSADRPVEVEGDMTHIPAILKRAETRMADQESPGVVRPAWPDARPPRPAKPQGGLLLSAAMIAPSLEFGQA